MTIRIGVDTGGTFTDLLCLGEQGLRVHKLRSVPADPSRAILEGIRFLVGEISDEEELEVTHGSTVATNAVLERKGARAGMVTTAGFEDVLHIRRQARPKLYSFMVTRSEPLIPRERIFGVKERVAFDGSIVEALNVDAVHLLTNRLREAQVESVAICFMHSYANPIHEQVVAAALRSAGFSVSASHEVLPEYREYERWSTTAVNAYVAPLMDKYLTRLQKDLGRGRLRVMQSNGGSISAARAGREAVQTILSGPAAGVIGAQAMGAASGHTRLITFDMGGTSTDVSLLDGAISHTSESLVGDLPVRLPVLDIHTVGAGGGSVAWIDAGGALRVGPRSAGAEPGPACFGKGDELTVTDANLLLGRLDPGYFLGGRISFDLSRVQTVARQMAAALGLPVRALAEGVLRIANANMERAVRVVSVQRGFDPRDFALLAFGGAGGLHACELASSLDMNTVLIPEHSGVLSAMGMLLADVVRDYSVSVLQTSHILTEEMLHSRLAELRERARTDLAMEGFTPDAITLAPALAMRYKGQAFEIDVPLPNLAKDSHEYREIPLLEKLTEAFHDRHAKLYGYSNPLRATEAVQLRLRATGRTAKPSIEAAPLIHSAPHASVRAEREVVFHNRGLKTAIFRRSQLRPGNQGTGPTMIVTGESTNIIPPHWTWCIDGAGTLVATSEKHLRNHRGKQANLSAG